MEIQVLEEALESGDMALVINQMYFFFCSIF